MESRSFMERELACAATCVLAVRRMKKWKVQGRDRFGEAAQRICRSRHL